MNRNSIILFIATLLGFWVLFFALQNNSIYKRSLGLIAKNWENQDGERKLVKKPYDKLDNNKLIRWDAVHYQLIKNYGYSIEKAGGDYIFAFFPMFPLVWKISNLPPIGILFLNYLLFSLSILILVKLFSAKEDFCNNIILALSLPSLVIFFIPYTEAVFLFTISIGIYGFLKNKYWLYFLGFLLASLTRPCLVFLMLSFIGTEFLFFLEYKKFWLFVKNIILKVAPLIVGTGLVSIIQLLYGSKSIFKFIDVQKYWNHVLSIPHSLGDWSHEGYGINVGVIFIIVIPLLIILLKIFYNQFFKPKTTNSIIIPIKENYLIILSIFYLIGITLFIIFFQGGSLHNLFRYTLNTPFFFILMFSSYKLIKHIPKNYKLYTFSTLSILSILVMGFASYSSKWNFSDFGFFLLISTMFLWLFQENSSNPYYKRGLYLNLFLNVLWSTYLFNSYIIDGWIFA